MLVSRHSGACALRVRACVRGVQAAVAVRGARAGAHVRARSVGPLVQPRDRGKRSCVARCEFTVGTFPSLILYVHSAALHLFAPETFFWKANFSLFSDSVDSVFGVW